MSRKALTTGAKFFGAVALGFFTHTSLALAGPVTGAIFTTDINGTHVNSNVYEFADDVFLNGGPRPNAPCTAAGLPDGDYVFQVTDPSGKELLTTDEIINRTVRVEAGLITKYYGGTARLTGNGKCIKTASKNISVGLFPFLLTPNPAGEYKVWMTRVDDYDETQTTPGSSFGFIPSKSKTDNFKVLPCPDGTVLNVEKNTCEAPPPEIPAGELPS